MLLLLISIMLYVKKVGQNQTFKYRHDYFFINSYSASIIIIYNCCVKGCNTEIKWKNSISKDNLQKNKPKREKVLML